MPAPQLIICARDDSPAHRALDAAADLTGRLVTDDWAAACDAISPSLTQLFIADADPWNDAWLRRLAELRPIENRLVVVLLSPSREAEHAIGAIGAGCWEYLIKPVEPARLAAALDDAARIVRGSRAGDERDRLLDDDDLNRPRGSRLIGQSPAMLRVYKQIGQAAPSDFEVLVTGESGTGKELVCRAIHDNSPRRDGPFIAINCAAIPDQLLESELFGHEKGAFTGADRRRLGKFELAAGGTVLLDEIGDMSPILQAKLLRLIQDRTFYRVGGNELLRADVRLLAATHQPLERLIAEKKFRADLYYRLKVMHIALAPLRSREEDVIMLAHHFVAQNNARLGRNITAFHPWSIKRLLEHDWPGNVRELENVIKQAMAVAHGGVLLPEFLPEMMPRARLGVGLGGEAVEPPRDAMAPAPATTAAAPNGAVDRLVGSILDEHDADALDAFRDRLEGALLRAALDRHDGNISAAARHLGVTRVTLRKKLKALNNDE
ncbi:MAG: sigma-54 interaction domain-containing protein [Phycisphaerales bacterium]